MKRKRINYSKRTFIKKQNTINEVILNDERYSIIMVAFLKIDGRYIITYQEPCNDEVLEIYGGKEYVEKLFSHSNRKLTNFLIQI